MGKLTEKDLRRIADLAHLRIADAEVRKSLQEMNQIVDHFARLNQLDTSGVGEMAQVESQNQLGGTPLAEDQPRPSLAPDLVMQNAPERRDNFFKVPPVIDDGE